MWWLFLRCTASSRSIWRFPAKSSATSPRLGSRSRTASGSAARRARSRPERMTCACPGTSPSSIARTPLSCPASDTQRCRSATRWSRPCGGQRRRRANRLDLHRRLRARGGWASRRRARDDSLARRARTGRALSARRRRSERSVCRSWKDSHVGGGDSRNRPLPAHGADGLRRCCRGQRGAACARPARARRRAGAVHRA